MGGVGVGYCDVDRVCSVPCQITKVSIHQQERIRLKPNKPALPLPFPFGVFLGRERPRNPQKKQSIGLGRDIRSEAMIDA